MEKSVRNFRTFIVEKKLRLSLCQGQYFIVCNMSSFIFYIQNTTLTFIQNILSYAWLWSDNSEKEQSNQGPYVFAIQ